MNLFIVILHKSEQSIWSKIDWLNILMFLVNIFMVIYFTIINYKRENKQNKYLSESRWFQEVFFTKKDITDYYIELRKLITKIEKKNKVDDNDIRNFYDCTEKFIDGNIRYLQVMDTSFFQEILLFIEEFSDDFAVCLIKLQQKFDDFMKVINNNEIELYKKLYNFDVERKYHK